MAGAPDVRVRRVYDQPSPDDGQRVLVDRLWPRGLSRETAQVDQWLKEVAPSTELRRWYGHEPARFAEFRRRYASELREPARAEALTRLAEAARQGPITLLTATKDAEHSQAALLAEQLVTLATDRTWSDEATGPGDDEDTPGDPACWLGRVCPACGSVAPVDPPTTCPNCRATIPRG
jgi:uncharacterized protein YeaO (DUF488 family)